MFCRTPGDGAIFSLPGAQVEWGIRLASIGRALRRGVSSLAAALAREPFILPLEDVRRPGVRGPPLEVTRRSPGVIIRTWRCSAVSRRWAPRRRPRSRFRDLYSLRGPDSPELPFAVLAVVVVDRARARCAALGNGRWRWRTRRCWALWRLGRVSCGRW